MKRMRKDGRWAYVPDVFVDYYRSQGYVAEGDEPPSVVIPPEGVTEEELTGGTEPAAGEEEPEDPTAEEAGDDSFVCPECGKVYQTKSGLTQHMKKAHPEE